MRNFFQQLSTVGSSRLQLHHARKSLSPEPPHHRLLLVRARAYRVTVGFPQNVVRSDRRARVATRAQGKKYDFVKLYVALDEQVVIERRREAAGAHTEDTRCYGT
jgi:hypothetical protein